MLFIFDLIRPYEGPMRLDSTQIAQRAFKSLKLVENGDTNISVDAIEEAAATRVDSTGRLNNAPNNGLRIPEGINPSNFDSISSAIRGRADELGLGDDIFVQGSRSGGTAGPNSDLDVAIRVSPAEFDRIMNDPSLVPSRVHSPNPGSASERTRQTAIEQGRLHAGEARLNGLANQISDQLDGMPVDISIIRAGGPFDNGPQTPLSFDFD